MDFFEVIEKRRSIRKFKPDPVSDELITKILEAGRIAPSGSNSQPWKFLVIRKPQIKEQICDAAAGQKFIKEAGAVIVILGSKDAYKKRLRRGKELVEIGAVDEEVLGAVSALYKKRGEVPGSEERTIFTNCAIAADHMVLAATALGLGSCWVMLMDSEKVAEILNLDKNSFPVALIPVGYPDQDPKQRPRYSLEEVAFDEDLSKSWKTE